MCYWHVRIVTQNENLERWKNPQSTATMVANLSLPSNVTVTQTPRPRTGHACLVYFNITLIFYSFPSILRVFFVKWPFFFYNVTPLTDFSRKLFNNIQAQFIGMLNNMKWITISPCDLHCIGERAAKSRKHKSDETFIIVHV